MAGCFLRRALLSPALLLAYSAFAPLAGAEPEIRNISLHGLQVGGITKLVVDGDGLGANPQLLLPFAAKVSTKPGGTDKQATFEAALGADVVPGYYQLRVVNGNSLSLPVIIAVDRLPQLALTPRIERLPVALHGTITGSAVVETTFVGKAGQKVTIEVESQRLGSKLRPVIHLHGPKRLQLDWAWSTPSLQGDARLDTTLPEDGDYRITLHDGEYQASAAFFRLRVGAWSYVDQVFPPVVAKDTLSVELLGSASVRADVPTARKGLWLPLAWPGQGDWSGPRPYVQISSRTEVVETPGSTKPRDLPAGPVSVCGRLTVPFAEDRYRVPVAPGSKVRFEVFAERIGSPIDTALVLRNESGAALDRNEDGVGTLDPAIEFTVPAKVTAVVVGVVDSQGRGGSRGIYRLLIDPVDAGRNEFELVTPERRLAIPTEGRSVFPVWADRRGFNGPIELKAEGLPKGLKMDGLTIPSGADGTLVSLMAGAGGVSPAITTWHGRASDGRERPVLQKNHPMERLQPWLAAELGVGSSSTKGGPEFHVEWKDLKQAEALVAGRSKTLKVRVTRADPVGAVRLTLLTSQPPIMLNNAVDPNRNLRLQRPVELPAQAVPKKMLSPPPDQEGEIAVLVPIDLPADQYDLAVQAELLAPNKQTVIAASVTPVQRLPLRQPVTVKLDGPNRIEVKLDAKKPTVVEIAGKIERGEGPSDVQITLAGLPAGARAEPLVVKSAETSFRLKVTLPPTLKPGLVEGLKLSGAVTPAAKLVQNQRPRLETIDLALNIVTAK
jgi:hypothetical protein